ncbi:hypothetical protein ES703_62454 [subsurface metagenome]
MGIGKMMIDNVKIRKAKKEDLNKVSEIFRIEFAKSPYNEKWIRSSSLNRIKEYLKKGSDVFVAESNKKILGFVIVESFLWDDGRVYFIDEVVVKKEFQAKGVGNLLINFIEKLAKKNRAKRIELMAVKDSYAFKFYNKLKFNQLKNFVYLTKKLK